MCTVPLCTNWQNFVLKMCRFRQRHAIFGNVRSNTFHKRKKRIRKNDCRNSLRTGREGPEGERRYSCTPSSTSALNGGGGYSYIDGRTEAAASPLHLKYKLIILLLCQILIPVHCGVITALLMYILLWGTLLVAQLVEALRYKSEGRRFDSRWCHRNFSLP